MIVVTLTANPSYTLREQLRRLRARNPWQARWITVNAAVAGAIWLFLLLGPAAVTIVLPTMLWSADLVIVIATVVVAALLTQYGGRELALWWWKRVHPVLVKVASLLVVEAAQLHDQEERTRLTEIERKAVEALRDELANTRLLAGEAARMGNADKLREAVEHYNKVHRPMAGRLSRPRTVQRLELIEKLLYSGANAAPADVPTYATVARGVAGEIDGRLERLQHGKPLATSWTFALSPYDDSLAHMHAWIAEFGTRWP